MSKFKVGDVVKRLGCTHRLTRLAGGEPYVVTAISGDYVQINNWEDRADGKVCPWYANNFVLSQEQDDPLPPAPKSMLYNQGDDTHTMEVRALDENNYYGGRVRITLFSNRWPSLCTVLSPDDTLQLCHDLRRMAMEIRRKERNGN